MSRLARIVILVGVLVGFAVGARAETRVATVHSAFHNAQYKDEHTPVIKELGGREDQYENTHIADLIARIGDYDLVVLNSVFNYENPQDFARYAADWRRYVENGGCIIATDVNYPAQFAWLPAVHPGLAWTCKGEMSTWSDSPVKWVDKEHPLMRGVRPPGTPWTQVSSWSQVLTPLVVDGAGRPVIAYLEIGRGIVVLSSAYRQYGWPDAQFYRNLLDWTKDPSRLESAAGRQAALEQPSRALPSLDVPVLAKPPAVDGMIGGKEWAGSATVQDFVGINGPLERTVCRVAQTPDALHIAFECTESDLEALAKDHAERDNAQWMDDCVEVFLSRNGEKRPVYHFAVNPLGVQYDERSDDQSWDCVWTAKTGIRPGAWCAEISIPFYALGDLANGNTSAVWTANFDRRHRVLDGFGQTIGGWSPSTAGFADPARFGSLKGIHPSSGAFALAPIIDVTEPGRWTVGRNQVKLKVAASGKSAAAVRISCIDANSGRVITGSSAVRVQAQKWSEVTLQIPVDTDGKHALQFIAADAASPDRILAGSKVLRVSADPALTVRLLSPSFRGTIQSRDPQKRLHLKGSVGNTQASGVQVRTSITPDGKSTPCRQWAQTVRPDSDFDVSASLDDLPAGDYTLRVDLEDGSRKLLAWKQMPLRVLAPAPMEVTFDEKRVCYVDGKPFFPIGLYHVSPAALKSLNARNKEIGLPEITLEEAVRSAKEHGFNCIHHTWGMADENYLKIAQDNGLYVMPEVGAPDEESLKKMVATAGKYRNVLLWYGLDEPSGERLNMAIAAHDMFARIDPHRPVTAACCSPSVFGGAAKAYDIMKMDPYFIRYSPLTGIADWIEKGMKAGEGAKPIWVVPQAFTVSNSSWSEPTNDELRCQAYLSLVHGATGLIWYAYWSSEPYLQNPKGRNLWFLPDSHLWDYFTKLNAEVKQLSPIFLTGDSRGPAECDSKDIHSNLWTLNGARYLIAVNPTDKPVKCTLRGIKGTKAEVLFEGRSVGISGGSLADEFAPLAVHVYRL